MWIWAKFYSNFVETFCFFVFFIVFWPANRFFFSRSCCSWVPLIERVFPCVHCCLFPDRSFWFPTVSYTFSLDLECSFFFAPKCVCMNRKYSSPFFGAHHNSIFYDRLAIVPWLVVVFATGTMSFQCTGGYTINYQTLSSGSAMSFRIHRSCAFIVNIICVDN